VCALYGISPVPIYSKAEALLGQKLAMTSSSGVYKASSSLGRDFDLKFMKDAFVIVTDPTGTLV